MNTGVWFTNDLRVSDNRALSWSLNQNRPVVAFYIRQIETSPHRLQFVNESLIDLSEQLKKINIPFFVFENGKNEWLRKFLIAYEITTIATAVAHNFQRQTWQREFEKQFEFIHLNYFSNETLLDLDLFQLSAEQIPDNFTAFRQLVEAKWKVSEITTTPETLKPKIQIQPEYAQFLLKPGSPSAANSFTGGRTSGLKRIEHYFFKTEKILSYKKTRNGMLEFDDSSKFSPWLSVGCVSAREIYWALKKFELEIKNNESTYWLVFELLWRDYFKFLAQKYQNRFFSSSGLYSEKQNQITKVGNKPFEDWKLGKTPEPFINANMIELLETGWMSNRGRQNVANYLVKILQVDWTLGAKWFAEHLIDYDVESNWGNWLYQSGLGTDPRNRVFNPQLQAQMYDADKAYQQKWLSKGSPYEK